MALLTTPQRLTVLKATLPDFILKHVHAPPITESASVPLTKHNQEKSEGKLYMSTVLAGCHRFQVLV